MISCDITKNSTEDFRFFNQNTTLPIEFHRCHTSNSRIGNENEVGGKLPHFPPTRLNWVCCHHLDSHLITTLNYVRAGSRSEVKARLSLLSLNHHLELRPSWFTFGRGCVKIGTSSFFCLSIGRQDGSDDLDCSFSFFVNYSSRSGGKALYGPLYCVSKSMKRVFMLPFSSWQSFFWC